MQNRFGGRLLNLIGTILNQNYNYIDGKIGADSQGTDCGNRQLVKMGETNILDGQPKLYLSWITRYANQKDKSTYFFDN